MKTRGLLDANLLASIEAAVDNFGSPNRGSGARATAKMLMEANLLGAIEGLRAARTRLHVVSRAFDASAEDYASAQRACEAYRAHALSCCEALAALDLPPCSSPGAPGAP